MRVNRHGKVLETIRAIRAHLQSGWRGTVLVVGDALLEQRVRNALDPHELERVRFERPTAD